MPHSTVLFTEASVPSSLAVLLGTYSDALVLCSARVSLVSSSFDVTSLLSSGGAGLERRRVTGVVRLLRRPPGGAGVMLARVARGVCVGVVLSVDKLRLPANRLNEPLV